jgi:hypothetical protein
MLRERVCQSRGAMLRNMARREGNEEFEDVRKVSSFIFATSAIVVYPVVVGLLCLLK